MLGPGSATQHMSILVIPAEILSVVVGLGTPGEIRRWREVSRAFKKIVDDSPSLQYRLQLDRLGYIEPVKPRRDLSYTGKVEYLRRHRERLRKLTGASNTRIDFPNSGGRFMKYKFSRGVFAHHTSEFENDIVEFIPQSISVYEIPSFNRGLEECKSWSHTTNLGVTVAEFGLSIVLDLLVLFELGTSSLGDDSNVIAVTRIHLRSLRSGSAHPAAAVPVLSYPVASSSLADFSICFRIVGDYLMVMFNPPEFVLLDSILVVWNWVLGKQIVDFPTRGDSFAFISPNLFVVPFSRSDTLAGAPLEVIGQLDIYALNLELENQPLRAFQHITTLQLPEHNIDSLLVTFIGVDNSASPSAHSKTVPPSRIPSKVFDISPENEVLCVTVSVLIDEDTDVFSPHAALGVLLVHHSVILDRLKSLPQSDKPHKIPWSRWADKTVWADESFHAMSNLHFSASGHLASFIKERQVVIYDVRPCFLGLRAGQVPKGVIDLQNDEGTLVGTLRRLFTTGSSAACKPKVVSSFRLPTELEDPIIVMDEEHVILVDELSMGSTEFEDFMYIYAF